MDRLRLLAALSLFPVAFTAGGVVVRLGVLVVNAPTGVAIGLVFVVLAIGVSAGTGVRPEVSNPYW